MSVEIQGVGKPAVPADLRIRERKEQSNPTAETQKQIRQAREASEKELNSAIDKLIHTGYAFNKRLKFSVNKEINRIVVKVIDSNTDKVIKEIPPEEIQRLVARIEEAIGLLFDEKV